MKRWLFKLSAAMSLLLCVAILVLWTRSYWVGEGMHLEWHETKDGSIISRHIKTEEGRGGITFYNEAIYYQGTGWVDFFAKEKQFHFAYRRFSSCDYPLPLVQEGLAAELGFGPPHDNPPTR